MKAYNASKVCTGLGNMWSFTTNYASHSAGRIWLIWNPIVFDVDIVFQSAQLIHCCVTHKNLRKSFDCSFVYGFNKESLREQLWLELLSLEMRVKGAWFVGGDFNNPLNFEDRLGSTIRWRDIEKFRNCVESCELLDMKHNGARFTWNNKQESQNRVFSKIDRTLVNMDWTSVFPGAETSFLPEGLYDHCPALVKFLTQSKVTFKPFRYFNMWSSFHGFIERVK